MLKPRITFISTLLALAATTSMASANYRAKAIEVTDYVQSAFYDPAQGLYRAAQPADPKALPWEFMWGNGVQFSSLVGAMKWESARYAPAFSGFSKGLRRYFDIQSAVPGFTAYLDAPGGTDKYYDDNAWMVLAFVEAARTTKNPEFLTWARQTQNYVLSGWDEQLGGGIFWRQQEKTSKNTCSNAPTIVASLALYEATKEPGDLAWAKKIYAWTNAHLQDPADGLFWDNVALDGKIERTKWTYNTALMMRANLGLWRATGEKRFLDEAKRLSSASMARWVSPQSGALGDDARFNHLLAEAFLQMYEATSDPVYLNVVRRHADFGYRQVRDVRDGGYFTSWNAVNRPADERKLLIENASVARLFWLLVPYPDTEELAAQARDAARRGDTPKAVQGFEQTLASTSGPAPTQRAGK